jgi:regulator of protease activity HflC (stomatin/prohibitin superfamily)
VEIVRVTLDKITLPQEVKQRMIEAWDVTWHDVVEIARALTEAKAITAKAIGAGQAAYLEAMNEARARLEAAGLDRFVKLWEAEAEAWAEVRTAEIGQRAKWLDARGEALAELEAAKVGRDVAEVKAETGSIEARGRAEALGIDSRGRADARAIESQAEAAAEAERWRAVILSLQRDLRLDPETVRQVILKLAGMLTTASDFRAMVRFLNPPRPLTNGSEEPAQPEPPQ